VRGRWREVSEQVVHYHRQGASLREGKNHRGSRSDSLEKADGGGAKVDDHQVGGVVRGAGDTLGRGQGGASKSGAWAVVERG